MMMQLNFDDLLTASKSVLDSSYTGGHAAEQCQNRDLYDEDANSIESEGLLSRYPDRLSLLEAIGDLLNESLELAIASAREPYQTARRISLPQAALLQLVGCAASFAGCYVEDERRSADGS